MRRPFEQAALSFAAALAIGCTAASGDRSPSSADQVAPGDTLVWRGARGQFDDAGVMVGRPMDGPGGGFSVSVGSQFGVPEMEEVYRRLVALEERGAFREFSCPGDSVPRFRFNMILVGEGPVDERRVSFGHIPGIEYWGPQRCLNEGLQYLVARTFAEVDSGPSVDYGYKDPLTGKPLPDRGAGERHERWRPTCRCELRDSVQEWVLNGPSETTLGGAVEH
jgi:hypothetical protein